MQAAKTKLLRNRQYRLFLQAAAVSNLGDGIALLALPWLASLLTRDAAMIALVTAALRLPWLLFSIPAGLMADRIDRRTLVLWADALRFIVLLLLVLGLSRLPSFDQFEVSQANSLVYALAGVAFFLGVAEVLRDNTAQTLLPAIVADKDLEKANGQLWSAEQVAGQFLGPPLAGWLILQTTTSAFAVNAICVFLAWVLVFQIRLPRQQTLKAKHNIWQQTKEAFGWLNSHVQMLRLALMLGVLNFLAVGSLTVLILFSQDVLGLSAAQHGFLLISGAVGGVVGGFLCPPIISRLGGTRSVNLALVLFALPFLMIALTDQVLWVAFALFIEMFAAILWNVVTVSLRQRLIPSELLGRVNSVYRLIGWGMMPLGALSAGILVEAVDGWLSHEDSLRFYYAMAFFVSLLMIIYGWLKLRIASTVD